MIFFAIAGNSEATFYTFIRLPI